MNRGFLIIDENNRVEESKQKILSLVEGEWTMTTNKRPFHLEKDTKRLIQKVGKIFLVEATNNFEKIRKIREISQEEILLYAKK